MTDTIQQELTIIDSMLKSESYTDAMAATLDAAYYAAAGQTVPAFIAAGEDTAMVQKSVKEEKIATNIAGFYALECGLGLLSAQTNETPVAWLQKIIHNNADAAAVSVLNRFANATWKAGQPFRSIQRITRTTFTVFNFLPAGEIQKDRDQIKTAAAKLFSAMQYIAGSSTGTQLQKIRSLMQSSSFTAEMAAYMSAAYYTNTQQTVPPFLTVEEDTATIHKSVKDQKVATSIAGFYALECGLNYFAAKNIAPSEMLQSIVNNTVCKEDKMLFLRFANATWKAGQPFRSLGRITHDTFMPFDLLSAAEIEKDFVQIKTAAAKLSADIM